MADSIVLSSGSEAGTRTIGARIGAVLHGGERIALSGELGAGKTCFVRGLAEGLGIDPDLVRSPSFTLLIPYEGGRLPLYHLDLFRLHPSAVDRLSLREYLYGRGVAAIEWAERLEDELEDYLEIRLTFVGAESRCLVAVAHGVGYDRVLELLKEMAAQGTCL